MRPTLMPCQVDSYLRCLYTHVVRCVPYKPTHSKQSAVAHTPRWVLTLGQSPLYPEGGGQPSDTGFLRPLPPDGGHAAESTELDWSTACPGRDGDVKVLSVAKEPDGVEHVVDSPLPEGAAVAVCVDWERRYDHMHQHTGAALFRTGLLFHCQVHVRLRAVARRACLKPDSIPWRSGNLQRALVTVSYAAPDLLFERRTLPVLGCSA